MAIYSTVGQFLDTKGREVVTVDVSSVLNDCARTMVAHSVGSVIVTDGRAVEGIVTWRDVLACIVEQAGPPGHGPTLAIMTRDIHTVTEEQSLGDVEAMMVKRGIRHAPVVRMRNLVGLITRSDLVAWNLAPEVRDEPRIAGYLTKSVA